MHMRDTRLQPIRVQVAGWQRDLTSCETHGADFIGPTRERLVERGRSIEHVPHTRTRREDPRIQHLVERGRSIEHICAGGQMDVIVHGWVNIIMVARCSTHRTFPTTMWCPTYSGDG